MTHSLCLAVDAASRDLNYTTCQCKENYVTVDEICVPREYLIDLLAYSIKNLVFLLKCLLFYCTYTDLYTKTQLFLSLPGVDVAMNISSVDAPDGSLVPGVERRLSVTFTLLNNNEPDLNNDVADIEQSYNGTNFNFTSYVVDVNMTAADVTVEHQLMAVNEELVAGDLHWPVGSVQSQEFTMQLTVHN